MLILTRKPYQTIRIGDDISITLMEVKGSNQVRIGIDAPKHIPVHREELYRKIKQAGGGKPTGLDGTGDAPQ